MEIRAEVIKYNTNNKRVSVRGEFNIRLIYLRGSVYLYSLSRTSWACEKRGPRGIESVATAAASGPKL